jgi:hydrogenase expression/formation protein HypE
MSEFLPVGKLPQDLLANLIGAIKPGEDVLIGPGIGRDAAAVRVGDQVLVLKTDPITFPTADPGSYLVYVNSNDIACMGAEPKWLLTTALLPEGETTPELVERLFSGVRSACEQTGCALIGGHTEITEGLDRPILVGCMIGVANESSLIDPASAQAGDAIMMAGGIAVEGTSILATETAGELEGVVPNMVLERAARFSQEPGISVLPYARKLRAAAGVRIRAMHDPTEGGLATGLSELGEATGQGVLVHEEMVHVFPETEAIAAAFGLDPWGLIASGSLLFVIPDQAVEAAIRAFESSAVPIARIGTLTDDPAERSLVSNGRMTNIPKFPVDEIARFFAER